MEWYPRDEPDLEDYIVPRPPEGSTPVPIVNWYFALPMRNWFEFPEDTIVSNPLLLENLRFAPHIAHRIERGHFEFPLQAFRFPHGFTFYQRNGTTQARMRGFMFSIPAGSTFELLNECDIYYQCLSTVIEEWHRWLRADGTYANETLLASVTFGVPGGGILGTYPGLALRTYPGLALETYPGLSLGMYQALGTYPGLALRTYTGLTLRMYPGLPLGMGLVLGLYPGLPLGMGLALGLYPGLELGTNPGLRTVPGLESPCCDMFKTGTVSSDPPPCIQTSIPLMLIRSRNRTPDLIYGSRVF
ncbi:hypothetical protein R1sor_002583 [Riccia sorocarpa]|uniref:Uncharacterized protein n=1 Tax=Riccia sorocarpa TaxID=122646 RepID=A0ABD3H0W0_9MARC